MAVVLVGLVGDDELETGTEVTLVVGWVTVLLVTTTLATGCWRSRRVGVEHAPSPTAKHISAQRVFSLGLKSERSTGDSPQETWSPYGRSGGA